MLGFVRFFLESLKDVSRRVLRARTFVFVVVPVLICAVALMCWIEVACLELLFASSQQATHFTVILLSVIVLLLVQSFALSLLCLQLTAAAQAGGLAETAVLLLFGGAYTSVARQAILQPLLYIVAGKILVSVLLARFWHAKFREFRMRFKEKPKAAFYLQRRGRFLSCAWVVAGSWLISVLAFALALVELQNLLQLQGWEGFLLLATFFALFWIFVRNPHSHPEFFDET